MASQVLASGCGDDPQPSHPSGPYDALLTGYRGGNTRDRGR